MVAPLEVAPMDSARLVLPVEYPVDEHVTEVTTINDETNRRAEAVFLNENVIALGVVSTRESGSDQEDPLIYRETVAALAGLRRTAEAEKDRQSISSVEIAEGKLMRVVSYFDGTPGRDELTARIVSERRDQYVAHGLLKAGAPEDTIRGHNVEIVVLTDLESDGQPLAASLRKVHAQPGEDLNILPSYQKFTEEGAFTEEGLRLLHERAQGRPVVEIAALWKDQAYGGEAKLALYKRALQDSIVRNELWFMGIVSTEYRSLIATYGDDYVHTIGGPIKVKGEGASENVRLRPVMLDPHDFYDTIIAEAEAAQSLGDEETRRSKELLVWHFLDGLDLKHLSESTIQRLENMTHGRITR